MNDVIKKESDHAYIERRSNYIYVRYKDLVVVDLEGVKKHGLIFKELCDGKLYPLVVDATDRDVRMTYDARIETSKANIKLKQFSCQAIVANTTPTILFTNFFIKNHEKGFPIKTFENLDDALKWIKKYSDNSNS